MKALEILKNLKDEIISNEGIIRWDCSYEYLKKVENAIKEIEMPSLKKCSNCKKSRYNSVIYCKIYEVVNDSNFYCKEWEGVDEQCNK